MTRPHAVLFDLDGTLLDTVDLLLASMRHAFAESEIRPETAEWVAGIGIPLRTMLRRFARDDEHVEALLTRYREYQSEHHDRMMRCYDEVVATLEVLHQRGHPMGVVTSKMSDFMNRSLDFTGIARFFDVTVGMEASTRHKPDPDPVHVALAALGYEPAEAVFVGDSPHDVLAGNAAGVTTVAALWGPFSRAQLLDAAPDHWLERITDLVPLLERIAATVRRSPVHPSPQQDRNPSA